MKTLFIALFFSLINFTTPKIVGTYQIESKQSFDTLELSKHGTFTYHSRGSSCWAWTDYSGKWKQDYDILTLYRTHPFIENSAEFIEQEDESSKDIVKIKVIDLSGLVVPNFEITYESAGLKTQTKKTKKNGIAIFNKDNNTLSKDGLAFIKVKFNDNNEIITKVITEIKEVKRSSNLIILTIRSNSEIIEKYKFKIGIGYKTLTTINFPYVTNNSVYKRVSKIY